MMPPLPPGGPPPKGDAPSSRTSDSAAATAVEKGKAPVASRTRSKIPPPTTSHPTAEAVPRPPLPSHPPPSASSSAVVDSAIAQRRAELRRLQQKRGGPGGRGGAAAAARARLGGVPARPSRGGGSVAATAALLGRGASAPLPATSGSGAETGATRRLDASLAQAATASPPQDSPRPLRLDLSATGTPGLTKRTSEIFSVGKQQAAEVALVLPSGKAVPTLPLPEDAPLLAAELPVDGGNSPPALSTAGSWTLPEDTPPPPSANAERLSAPKRAATPSPQPSPGSGAMDAGGAARKVAGGTAGFSGATVPALASLVERGRQRKEGGQKQGRQHPATTGSSNQLLDQLKELVATQGESAGIAWISKQLEEGRADRAPPSPALASPVMASSNGNLLSSVIPPLTPRSRPGSRAASPERGGGGGLLRSQTLGQALDPAGSARGKRMTTPLPKQLHLAQSAPSLPLADDREGWVAGEGGGPPAEGGAEREYLAAAAKAIPNDYGTQLASYTVRRPYVAPDTDGDDNAAWGRYAPFAPGEAYLRRATVLDPHSLEVVARVDADGSVFTLTGKADARHGRPSKSAMEMNGHELTLAFDTEDSLEWAIFDDVEEMSDALGCVTYIDVEGNEREYWLDSIYEEALTTRESYCMSMISAAHALKEVTGSMAAVQYQQPSANCDSFPTNVPMPPPSPMVQPLQAQPGCAVPSIGGEDVILASGADRQPVVVGNDTLPPPVLELPKPRESADLPVEPSQSETNQPHAKSESQEASQTGKERSTSTTGQTENADTPVKPMPEEDFESADSALPFMVVSIFSLLFSVVWFFVKIPFRIGSLLFKFWALIVMLRILQLLLADDNGAWDMGAGVDFEYNMPGIY